MQPDDRYRIGPGDVLDIRILNRPHLSRDAVRVEGNGMIRMPLIEVEIQAACRSEGELAKEICAGLFKVLPQSAGGCVHQGVPCAPGSSDGCGDRAGAALR